MTEPYWGERNIECRDSLDICPRCGALVSYWQQDVHQAWHQDHNDWPWDVAE